MVKMALTEISLGSPSPKSFICTDATSSVKRNNSYIIRKELDYYSLFKKNIACEAKISGGIFN